MRNFGAKIKMQKVLPVVTHGVSPGQALNAPGEVPVGEQHRQAVGRGVIPGVTMINIQSR